MIRVLIKASSPLAQAGLEALLRSYPQFELIDKQTEEANALEDLLTDSEPDVVVAEVDTSESVTGALAGSGNDRPLLLLVRDPTAESVRAFRRGVSAVLPSNATAPQIVAAIEAVAAGLGVFDPEAVERFPPPSRVLDSSEPPVEPLTPRETEVLRAMAEGLANKEIAVRLGVSENTVKFHVASVMGKLGAGSRTEAVMQGIRLGIVLI